MTLEFITSDVLSPVRHGFFTRRGGASSGIFEGLNCGTGSSDQSEIISINRARVADAMQVAPEELAAVHQVHSADTITVPFADKSETPRADAMVTRAQGMALTILTADCQPVLFADHSAGVIGAAHAGWKGALTGILEATLEAMEGLGAKRSDIAAVIGPTIGQANYEVGQEFLDTFLDDDTGNAAFFANGRDGRFQFNLPGYGLNRLRSAGVGHAEWSGHCTYADPSRFYSYRRSTHQKQADYGRLISAICL
ncbi:MAG: peptidoglycan editing factor PgeF [Marinosulfonomonas sp.]|nr:peptidoglycan editing factor PgeF [Marinosulfonomonas sp.]